MPPTKELARVAVPAAGTLAVALRVGALTPGSAAIAAAALAGTSLAFATRAPRPRALLFAAAAVAGSALFVVDLGAWMRVAFAGAVAHLVVAAVPGWRGRPRGTAATLRDLACGPGVALVVPLALAGGAVATGREGLVATALAAAAPPGLAQRLLVDALLVATLVLACDGRRADRPRAAALGGALTAVAVALAVGRVAWAASLATVPVELSWSEAPALVNAMKLDAHRPLYGPPGALDSYTYSPLLDLAHHAVLAPIGLELDLAAHRALAAVEQLLACAVLAWALAPRLIRAGWGGLCGASVLLALCFANMLAPNVHPDHLVLVAFAVAVALLIAEPRWPRALWWGALVTVAPFAAAAKLTGAGVGVGMAAVFLLERRWRPLLAVVVSLACAAATVPLFDATLGAYRFYAIDVQRAHPVVWAKLWGLPFTPAGAVALGAAASVGWLGVGGRRLGSDALRVGLLTLAAAVATLPAWLKYAGRDNNLALLGLGAACTWLVAGARHVRGDGPVLHRALFPAGALLALSALAPPSAPFTGAARAAALDEIAGVRRMVEGDTAAGRTTLVPLSAAEWLAAGRRDVPADRYQSAVELFYGGFPEASLFFAHVEDGRYDTIVVDPRVLRDDPSPLGRFGARLRAAVDARYEAIGPAAGRRGDRDAGGAPGGAVVYRRRTK